MTSLIDPQDFTDVTSRLRQFFLDKNYLEVHGVGINGFNIKKNTILNAGNSGTLARSILGLCSSINNKIKFRFSFFIF